MAPKTHPKAAETARARDDLLAVIGGADPDMVLAVARLITTRGRTRTTARRLNTLAATIDASLTALGETPPDAPAPESPDLAQAARQPRASNAASRTRAGC